MKREELEGLTRGSWIWIPGNPPHVVVSRDGRSVKVRNITWYFLPIDARYQLSHVFELEHLASWSMCPIEQVVAYGNKLIKDVEGEALVAAQLFVRARDAKANDELALEEQLQQKKVQVAGCVETLESIQNNTMFG